MKNIRQYKYTVFFNILLLLITDAIVYNNRLLAYHSCYDVQSSIYDDTPILLHLLALYPNTMHQTHIVQVAYRD